MTYAAEDDAVVSVPPPLPPSDGTEAESTDERSSGSGSSGSRRATSSGGGRATSPPIAVVAFPPPPRLSPRRGYSPPPSFVESQRTTTTNRMYSSAPAAGKSPATPPSYRYPITAPAKAWQRRGNALNAQKLCGFIGHIERAAFFVGAFGTLASALLIVFLMKMNYSIQHVVFAGIVFTSYLLVLLAEEAQQPSMMWLYLILNPICIGLIAGAFIYPSVVFLIGVDLFDKGESNPRLVNLARLMAMTEIVLSVVGIVSLVYFQSIVFRAYRWMLKQRSIVTSMGLP